MDAYFDNNATTPVDPRVVQAMLPWLEGRHGNPSSNHRFGRPAREAVDKARRQVAELLDGEAKEIVFTSSGSEANNTVIRGLAEARGHRGHLLISGLEHPSILRAADVVAKLGVEVEVIPPSADGVVSAEGLRAALRPDTFLVCLMLANNELGTLQPVQPVAATCRERGIPVLCDAVQGVGKVPVSVRELAVDYLVLGGHKFHGPLGCAALWVHPQAVLEPMIVGALQEGGKRASTENVPAIVGLGEAARLAGLELEERHRNLLALRQQFEDGLRRIPGAVVHCAESERLPHTSLVAFRGVPGHELMGRLDEAGFAVSTGAACSSGRPSPSRVLTLMGCSPEEALGPLRVSFGITNTSAEVEALLAALEEHAAALRRVA